MTAYGTTLDSLMAGKLGARQADIAEDSAYREYLARLADTRSMDAYRRGDIDVRRQDVAGNNEYRRSRALADAMDANTRRMDVESLSKFRPEQLKSYLELERLRGENRIAERNTPEAITPEYGRLLEAQADALTRGGGVFGNNRDAGTLAVSDTIDRSKARSAIPMIAADIESEVGKIVSGSRWYNDTPEYDAAEEMAKNLFGDTSKEAVRRAAYRMATTKVLRQLAADGLADPSMFSISFSADGRPVVSVGESPFESMLSGARTPTAPAAAPRTAPAPAARTATVPPGMADMFRLDRRADPASFFRGTNRPPDIGIDIPLSGADLVKDVLSFQR